MGRSERRWIETLARAGFAAKGIVYLLLGGLSLRVALGTGGRLTDPQGVIAGLLVAPFGRLVVVAVALGLALYAAWRFLEAFADANRKGREPRGLGARGVYALSGAVYAILAIDAATLAFARGTGVDGSDLPATILTSPLTRWAALLVAGALVGYGVLQVRRALSARLSDQLSPGRVERHMGRWAVRVSRVGIAGRAAVLIAMGVVLARRASTSVRAAAQTDTGDSLRLIAALPTGDWLLAAIATGLVAYGIFQLIHARYRTITAP